MMSILPEVVFDSQIMLFPSVNSRFPVSSNVNLVPGELCSLCLSEESYVLPLKMPQSPAIDMPKYRLLFAAFMNLPELILPPRRNALGIAVNEDHTALPETSNMVSPLSESSYKRSKVIPFAL